jgi:Family of unknown function (DUF6494)
MPFHKGPSIVSGGLSSLYDLALPMAGGAAQEGSVEQFNMTMRKYLKEVGVTSQQAIERVVREEKLAGKGKLKVKMILTGEGTGLKHVVEGEIDLVDAQYQ